MQKFLDKQISHYFKKFSLRDFAILTIIFIAILSRLIGLGNRVMSHDEVNHVVPAFDLFSGRGYRHDPITHGPLQFHLMGLSYFLLGDNDFTSRLPHAIFAILTIAFVMIYFHRYLGKIGSLAAGILFTISPFMLFYGRYARNDIICVFVGVASIYSILRFFETKKAKYLYFLTISLALNFTAKETAYIFSAQLLIFVFIMFVQRIFTIKIINKSETRKIILLNFLLISIIIISLAISVLLFRQSYAQARQIITTSGAFAFSISNIQEIINSVIPVIRFTVPGILPLVFLIASLLFLRNHLHWDLLSPSASFSILILTGTLVLPLLAPFLVRFAGMDPAAYSDSYVVTADYVFIGSLFIISYIIGSIWDKENWWKYAAVFYAIYLVLYSTFFTNPTGIMTGMVGSLGHWLNQQTVQRGGQPTYYYAFFLLPIYEFLPIFGGFLAFYFGVAKRNFWRTNNKAVMNEDSGSSNPEEQDILENAALPFQLSDYELIPDPAIYLFLFITGLIAYTVAGEKMPWLSLHIIFPLILLAAWAFNIVFEKFKQLPIKRMWITFSIFMAFIINTLFILLQLIGNNPPFQGQLQLDLQSTYRFIFLCLIEAGLLIAIFINYKVTRSSIWNLLSVGIVILLALVTIRTSYRAAFINYDNAKEYLVYAHAADGPRMILDQVEEISKRTTNGLDIKVAYDNHGLYPFWWYLRHYPNRILYLENPTRSLEEAPLIIAGQDKYAKLDPIVRDNYYFYEYMRLWWPMQDYWNLSWDKITSALLNKDMRQALFEIWFNRDYSMYAELKNNANLTLETWLPSEKTRLYIRKDIAAKMWQYVNEGTLLQELEVDPYAEKLTSQIPDGFISLQGSAPGELNSPRGIDIGPDGKIYVADSRNHRIQVFSPDGSLENSWGTFANVLEEDAPGGTFNEPWDVAVSPDGSIFVADTFNHRIQKFDRTGRFVKMWGIFAQGQDPESFWGPRGIDVDAEGNILVTDTGNKRVIVFDGDLNYITQFGGSGFEPGQFDEPVGISVTDNGEVVVADTWNRRVQVFKVDETGLVYRHVVSFDIEGWYGQSIDNKPYLTADNYGNIYVTDPEAGRILQFSIGGEFIQGYQDLNTTEDLISYPYGIQVSGDGKIWFSDASSSILAFFEIE